MIDSIEPSRGSCVRTGTVLMKSPTIDSTCDRLLGRPDTVAPNTTSSCPVYRKSNSAQAACTNEFNVN